MLNVNAMITAITLHALIMGRVFPEKKIFFASVKRTILEKYAISPTIVKITIVRSLVFAQKLLMDIHAIVLLDCMVSTVIWLIIALIIHVEGTENAVIQKAVLHACVMLAGLVTTVHLSIFVLIHHVDNMAYVKIILITSLACVTTVTLDINVKSLIFVWKNHVKIMEHVFHIPMVTCVIAWTHGRVRNVINEMFAFWITLVIRMGVVL